jgi:hypothetical protein
VGNRSTGMMGTWEERINRRESEDLRKGIWKQRTKQADKGDNRHKIQSNRIKTKVQSTSEH